jgi:hypothetical protein
MPLALETITQRARKPGRSAAPSVGPAQAAQASPLGRLSKLSRKPQEQGDKPKNGNLPEQQKQKYHPR